MYAAGVIFLMKKKKAVAPDVESHGSQSYSSSSRPTSSTMCLSHFWDGAKVGRRRSSSGMSPSHTVATLVDVGFKGVIVALVTTLNTSAIVSSSTSPKRHSMKMTAISSLVRKCRFLFIVPVLRENGFPAAIRKPKQNGQEVVCGFARPPRKTGAAAQESETIRRSRPVEMKSMGSRFAVV